jgi:PTH1 family peptidyl-tRNA hydrolase
MKLIVGLGNPGLRYKFTRHNIGFRVIDALAQEHKIRFKTNLNARAKVAGGSISGQDFILFKSLRFMNLCGLSVVYFMLERNISPSDLLVICDCLDLPFGSFRLRSKGSDAGHRGLRSIIASLGRSDFSRLKIGIGRPQERYDISDYVLSRFIPDEERQISQLIKEAKIKIDEWFKLKRS